MPDQTESEDHGSIDEEDREDEPGVGDNAIDLDDDVMKICLKMTLMMMMISSILSTSFLNRMMIQMSISMKKKIQNKDDTYVELDQVHNYIF
jgi:hypothetical protein